MPIKVTQELWLTFRDQEGNVVAIEKENGEIVYITERSSNGKSAKAFGADLPRAKV